MMTIDQLNENARRMAERRQAIKDAEALEKVQEHAPLPPPYCKFCGCGLRANDYVSVPACVDCALRNTKPKSEPMRSSERAAHLKKMREDGKWKS